MKNRKLLSGLFCVLLVVFIAVILNNDEKPTSNQELVQSNKLELVFDVPSLVGLNVDEIVKSINLPNKSFKLSDEQMLNSSEEDMTFEKNGFQLLVTYNSKNRQVKDFFVGTNDEMYQNRDIAGLMEITNTSDKDSNYKITFIPAMKDSSRYTGILITPNI